jgi:triosephosphate isomerase
MKNPAKRRKLVVGNWKMNPQTLEEARAIAAATKRAVKKVRGVDAVICPPFPFVSLFAKLEKPLFLGAQDVFWEDSGSFTGEVSARMLAASGCSYVIVGHSERRAMGETDEMVSRKALAALKTDMRVIICVGEQTRDEHASYLEQLKNQIKDSLARVPKRLLSQVVIAYEPVWAIGKSYTDAMTGADMQQMSIFIQKVLADIYGKDEAAGVAILYGGSVAPINARDIISHGQVDGFLVGRQSLDGAAFSEIISIVGSVR